jgi:hypothetical protein
LAWFLPAGGAIPAETARTNIREALFSISLPGKWTAVKQSEPGLHQYECDRFREALSVSTFPAQGVPLSQTEAQVALNSAVKAAREAVGNIADMDLMETKLTQSPDGATAFYQGRSKSDLFIAYFGVSNPAGVFQVFYEARGIPPAEFAKRVADILSDVHFATER